MKEKITKVGIAREYRLRYGAEMPTMKLARIMYKENKLLFIDVESARSKLRYIEGKTGVKHRKHITEKQFLMETSRPLNPYSLPKSDEAEYKPYIVKGYKKIGGLFDVHAPYHSMESLTSAIRYLKKEKIDLLLLGGDFWDFHGLSRFLHDPKKRRIGEEIKIGIDILKVLHKELKCKIVYKLGNHCERLQHFLWQKWGEIDQLNDLEEIKEITLENIVRRRLPDIDIDFVDDKRIIKANDLNIVHGHEFASSIMSPVNIARGLYLRAKANTVCGHHHRSSEHTEMNIEGKIVTTWSVGCLSELHPQYMPINSWNHGFLIIELHDNKKEFTVQNKRIFNGKVL